jgi:hypothetical protein|tara:strand:- start:1815 stop:2078 length:264 start_codon:yes stop_codon:yes gene_type:complete
MDINPYLRTVEGSSRIFGGFQIQIDIRHYDSVEQMTEEWKNNLHEVLQKHNFIDLLNTMKTKNFHIHTQSFEEILIDPKVIYVCDSC